MSNRKPFAYGVGINDADYVTKVQETIGRVNGKQKQVVVWRCPFYTRWMDMLRRCYSPEFKDKSPSYEGCSVCEEWLRFSKFKAWMETQDWEGKQLDKDLIILNNKVYSPETCVFVSKALNLFAMEAFTKIGEYPSGVYFNTNRRKFYAQCKDPLNRNNAYLGSFNTPEQAHVAWAVKKLEYATELSIALEDKRLANALKVRYMEILVRAKAKQDDLQAKAAQNNLKEKAEELLEVDALIEELE